MLTGSSRFTLIPVLLSIVTQVHSDYIPNVELSTLLGNKRDVGRVGLVVPVWQKNKQLLYFTGIGLLDSQSSREGNFGVGYRQQVRESIYGGYGYYDIRKSPLGNIHQQITLGVEYLKHSIELRANGYLPISQAKTLSSDSKIEVGSRTIYRYITNRKQEIPLGGFDVEIGGTLPKLNRLSAYGAYYHFGKKQVKSIDGFRLRGEIKVSDHIFIKSEYSHDNLRKSSYFFGIGLKASLGHKNKKLSILDKKMTQLPVRDIDIVTVEGDGAVVKEQMDARDLSRAMVTIP